jgi:hypothetical protein
MQVNIKTGSSTQTKSRSKITEDASRVAQIGTKKSARKSAARGRRRAAKKTVKAIISGMQRHQLISEAAYFKAEQRGFEGDDAIRDWLEAEAYIDSMYRIEG